MSALGQRLSSSSVSSKSAHPSTPDTRRPQQHVGFVPIVLQKSFCVGQHKFSGPCARRSNNHLRDYMFCYELTGAFGNGLEMTSVGNCGSFGPFAGN
jgi:hypothetical protein